MIGKRLALILSLVLLGTLLAACGQPAADTIATRVAEEQAVAATLTASAPQTGGGATTETAAPAPTETAVPAATEASPTEVSPTEASPTAPAPSPTPLLIAVLPVDGGGGDVPNIRNDHPVKGGRNVTLPGFTPAEASEPMVFGERISLRAEVFDANVGSSDGAGIEAVRFTITDDRGQPVYSEQDTTPAYCAFGDGGAGCVVLDLAQAGYTWPNGETVYPGAYQVTIDIQPQYGDTVSWLWSFRVQFAKHMARIDGIEVQGSHYAIDFETFGYTAQLPGEHVHFFFDTVPAEQAGVPGQGPWKLYGGSSPFTEYGPGDRPPGATQMCILVANADHSVQANSGNCVDLP